MYRGGSLVGSTAATSFSDTGLVPSTAYSYTVAAYDNAGNTSGQSKHRQRNDMAAGRCDSERQYMEMDQAWNEPHEDRSVGRVLRFRWIRIRVHLCVAVGLGRHADVVLSPNFPDTRWARDIPPQNGTYTSVWRCLVTDSGGNTGENTVTVTFTMHTLQ